MATRRQESAAIHLAQMGLPDIGEDAAYRLSLAAELIGAGVAPRELGVLEAFRISISKQPLSRAPRRMGFRKLARPRVVS